MTDIGDFERAVRFVIQHEGGLSNHQLDRGGKTNWGITQALLQAVLPGRSVEDLTIAEAKQVYREVFWEAIKGPLLPPPVALALLDFAVHSGAPRAVRALQEAVGANPDGKIGPKTLDRVYARDPAYVAQEVCRQRISFLVDFCRRDTSQLVFLKGWMLRLFDLVGETARP